MLVFLRRFRDTRDGAIAITFGLSFLVLMLTVGLAYDSSRLTNVTTRVQTALDAAALAGAKLLDVDGGTDADVVAVATAFFNTHLSDISINGLSLAPVQVTPDRATSTVRAQVSGSLTSLFGGIAQSAPTLNFTRTVETTFKSKKIELSLVVDVTGSMNDNGKMAALKMAAKDLVDTLFATNPSPNAIRIALIPYSASVNAGSFKAAVAGTAGADNCVVERNSLDTTSDAAVGAGNWLGVGTSALNPFYSCPMDEVTPLTDLWDAGQRAAFKARIDAITPVGGTAGHIGLAWGWYFLSQNWAPMWPSHQRPRPPHPDVIKAVILMTDGIFNMSYLPNNMNSIDVAAPGSSGHQALELCTNMQASAANVQVYSVAFQAPVEAENLLRTCSGAPNYFDANSAGGLITAFREIAERLTSLRISS